MDALIPFNLDGYLADPTKLRGPEGAIPTFSAYSVENDNLYVEFGKGAKLQGITIKTRDAQPNDPGIDQDQLRGYLTLAKETQTVGYGVALGTSNGLFYPVFFVSQDEADKFPKTDFFVRWLVDFVEVDAE